MSEDEELCDRYGLIPTYTLDPVDGMTKIVTVEWSEVKRALREAEAR